MTNPTIYRKRIIPNEKTLLKNDIILECTDEYIVTKWNTLKPRDDFHHGYSIYYINEGFKISKFIKADGSLKYWYCDIIDYEYNPDSNELVATDLLLDVIVYPDGGVRVVDINEVVTALEENLISLETLKSSLRNLDKLLGIIYSGQFDMLKKHIPVDYN